MRFDKLKDRVKKLDREIPGADKHCGIYIIDESKGEKVSDIKNPPDGAIFLIDDVERKLKEQQEGVQAVNES
jgi:hypothetical protein